MPLNWCISFIMIVLLLVMMTMVYYLVCFHWDSFNYESYDVCVSWKW